MEVMDLVIKVVDQVLLAVTQVVAQDLVAEEQVVTLVVM